MTPDLVKRAIDDEIEQIRKTLGEQKFAQTKFLRAKEHLWSTVQGRDYAEFLTTLMYDDLVVFGQNRAAKL